MKDLIKALRGMAVETGSLVCLGCGYEHSCSVRGCTIINEAAARLEGIAELSSADVAPVRHGRWVGEGVGYAEAVDGEMALVYDVWRCSDCDHVIDDGIDDPEQLPNYCPHCGAKMDRGSRKGDTGI